MMRFRLLSAFLLLAGVLLLACGRIQVEGSSISTQESFAFPQAVLQASGIAADAVIRVATSNFHPLRAVRIARKAGLTNVWPAGSNTPLHMRYNARLHEYFAYVSGWLLREY